MTELEASLFLGLPLSISNRIASLFHPLASGDGLRGSIEVSFTLLARSLPPRVWFFSSTSKDDCDARCDNS